MKIKTIFFGSPTIASQLLEILLKNEHLDISLVVTQPDKPVGKRLELTPTKVKQTAMHHGIQVFDKDIRNKATLQELENTIMTEHFSLGILFAYGALIPESTINLFPWGIWNVHPSLLPLYRGPSPTAYPLLLGDSKTGVTIMQLVKKLDAGPIIAQKSIPVDPSDTRELLESKLTIEGGELISNAILNITKGVDLTIKNQDEAKSTYTRLLKKEDGYISPDLLMAAIKGQEQMTNSMPPIITEYMTKYDHSQTFTPARIVFNMFRACSPWPGIWTTVETNQGPKRLKIHTVTKEQNTVVLKEVQLEGKNSVDFKTFNSAYNFI